MGFETHNDLRVMNPAPIEKVRFVTATGFEPETLKLQLDLDWIQTYNLNSYIVIAEVELVIPSAVERRTFERLLRRQVL
jgi:hypothetical protein